jgi:hypothetical protein
MKKYLLSFVLFTFVLLTGDSMAQVGYTLSGQVTDAQTGEPVPFASVALVGRRVGTLSDEKGQFSLVTKTLSDSLAVSSLGYATLRHKIDPDRLNQAFTFRLIPAGTALQEITVRAGENPAFGILRQLRKNRLLNDRSRLAGYECDSYVKTDIALSRMSDKVRANPLFRRINDAMKAQDLLVDDEGNKLVPILASESVSRYYYRANPKRTREEVRKTRIKGIDVVDSEISSQLLGGSTLVNHNFFDSYIPILGKDFASPIGENWKSWYEFFLADTTLVGGRTCYVIEFEPKRPEDLAFTGKAWIDTTTFALCEIEARIGKGANLNYVRNLSIAQELEPTVDSASGSMATTGWLPVSVRLTADLTTMGKHAVGVRAQVTLHNSNILVNRPLPVAFFDQPIEPNDSTNTDNKTYWQNVQQTLAGSDSLSQDDYKTRQLIDTLRKAPAIKTLEAIGQIAITGFYKVGGLDIGPYPYLFAYNTVEGLRTRIGFRTNDEFSRNWILRGYLAYGTLDHRYKYGGEIDYILSRRYWSLLGVRMSYDLERLGLTPELIGGNRLFYALSRFGKYRGAYASHQKEIFFRVEPIKGVVITTTLGSRTFDPIFPFHFRAKPELDDQSPLRSDITDAYWSIEARFARKEKYIIDGNERITLGTKRAPVLTIRYTHGTQAFGSDYTYGRITMRAQQTLRLGVMGRVSYLLSAGYTPSKLPMPLLFPHIGNPTPLLTINTFNRMQFYEFVSDRFVAIHLQHKFEGLLFNRLPLIRKLNWRLVANADALWGGLSKTNQAFETGKPLASGFKPTHFGALNSAKPYLELGYGIDNIFKLFRIQAIHRLTYLEPSRNGIPVDKFVIKGSANFSF